MARVCKRHQDWHEEALLRSEQKLSLRFGKVGKQHKIADLREPVIRACYQHQERLSELIAAEGHL